MPAVKGFAIRHPVVQQIMIHRTQPLWRLLQAQLMVCFFLYFLFVQVYQQLLYSLTQIAKLVFYWLTLQITGLFILLHFGLKIPRTLHRILTKKLQREVLSLTAEILWHFQTAVRYIYFWLTDALQYWLASWISELFLLFCSSVEHQFHHFTYSFCQEKLEIYKAMLQPAIKQIVVSLFLGFLAGVQEAFCIVIQVLKYVLIQFFRSIRPTCHSASKAAILDDITSTLPKSCTPLCTRFKGPPINTFEDIPQTFVDLKFVVATEHTISGPGRYGLDGTNIPLHVRFQSFTGIRNASSIKKKDVPLTWLKVVCVFYVALYLSMFSGAVNNIK